MIMRREAATGSTHSDEAEGSPPRARGRRQRGRWKRWLRSSRARLGSWREAAPGAAGRLGGREQVVSV